MALTVQTVDCTAGTSLSLARSTARALCRGLIAVTLFLYALLLAADLNACMSEGWFTRTAALTGRLPLSCGLVAAQMGAASVSALIAFGLGAWFFGGADVTGFAAIVLYALMLTGLALTLAQLPAAHGWLTASCPRPRGLSGALPHPVRCRTSFSRPQRRFQPYCPPHGCCT